MESNDGRAGTGPQHLLYDSQRRADASQNGRVPAGTYPRNIMTCVISDWMLSYEIATLNAVQVPGVEEEYKKAVEETEDWMKPENCFPNLYQDNKE